MKEKKMKMVFNFEIKVRAWGISRSPLEKKDHFITYKKSIYKKNPIRRSFPPSLPHPLTHPLLNKIKKFKKSPSSAPLPHLELGMLKKTKEITKVRTLQSEKKVKS